ncbi:MAG: hypothetical protein H6810_10005 [Phycisphaeraceae bacterium]|nr:MAG: hypothetical protein H6810_10005 [Phycisphaeraceae bacterium]
MSLALHALTALSLASAQEVMTWDGGHPGWTVVSADTQGLHVEQAGQPMIVGWQSIRAVEGDHADEVRPFLPDGETAWRALSRLNRGDAFGAEPLFESLFETYVGIPGPTSAAISEGLLRCRLRRDARAAALEAWLDLYANLSASPSRQAHWGVNSPAIDDESLLAPALPPLWFDGQAARAFADMPAPTSTAAAADEVAWAMRVLYRAAARQTAGYPVDPADLSRAVTLAARREGSDFVANMVMAQLGGEQARRDARLMLDRQRLAGGPRWRAVWATIAIGRSLLREDGASQRRRGVLELLSVHALNPDVSPYLTGLALADAALGCEGLGDDHAARVLTGELRNGFPTHPVLEWPALRELWGQGPGRLSTP